MANSESQMSTVEPRTSEEIAGVLELLFGRSNEQHAFIDAMKYIHSQGYSSSTAVLEDIMELLPPEALLHASCLAATLLYKTLHDILIKNGIAVQRRQGLPMYKAVANAVYGSDAAIISVANQLMSDWRHSRTGSDGTASSGTAHPGGNDGESETVWRRVDAAQRRFTDAQKYSGILGESPTLPEARRAYLTSCDQTSFPRQDKVKLVSCILKGPALNYWTTNIEQNPEYTELGSVFSKLKGQFDTPAHQRQIEAMANNLTMELAKQKHSVSRFAALGILYHAVARLNQQFPV